MPFLLELIFPSGSVDKLQTYFFEIVLIVFLLFSCDIMLQQSTVTSYSCRLLMDMEVSSRDLSLP